MVARILRNHDQRIDGLEIEYGFLTQLDLLTFFGGCDSSAGSRAAGRSDRRASAAADNAAQNCACHGTDADFGCGALTLAFAGPSPLVGLNVVGLTVHGHRSELQGEDGISREASSALHIGHPANYVRAGWNYGFAINDDGRAERTAEGVTHLIAL